MATIIEFKTKNNTFLTLILTSSDMVTEQEAFQLIHGVNL